MDQTQTLADDRVLVGYFEDETRAERALRDLQNAGFTSAHIGVAHRGPHRTATATSEAKNSAEEMWDRVRGWFHHEHQHGDTRDAREQAGITSGNPEALDSSAYTQDDLYNSLTGMSVPEGRARYFSRRLRTSDRGAVVTVNAGERANIAEFILRDNGADLGENAPVVDTYAEPVPESHARDAMPVQAPASAPVATQTHSIESPQPAPAPQATSTLEGARDVHNLQLLGEVLRVHKERIDRGEVAVRKEVVTETQTIQVPVRREELVIKQHPPAAGAQAAGQEIRIPISQEKASVDKDTVVRENVAVGRKPVQDTRQVSGDLRHEELAVDDRTKRVVNE